MERIRTGSPVILERVPGSILELVQLPRAMYRGRVIGGRAYHGRGRCRALGVSSGTLIRATLSTNGARAEWASGAQIRNYPGTKAGAESGRGGLMV